MKKGKKAKKIKANGSVPSITEGYKHTLNAFLKSLENPKLYILISQVLIK